jgi:hypothetical protein
MFPRYLTIGRLTAPLTSSVLLALTAGSAAYARPSDEPGISAEPTQAVHT